MHIKKCLHEYLRYRLDILGKSKYGLNARRDLVYLKLRPELAPISSEKKYSFLPRVTLLRKMMCFKDFVQNKGF